MKFIKASQFWLFQPNTIDKTMKSRVYLILALFGILTFSGIRLYYRLTDDFRLSNITHDLPQNVDWKIPSLNATEQEQLSAILQQPFHYIGKGAQSYAFASQDGEYVLKFFKFKHLKPAWYLHLLPSMGPLARYKQAVIEKKSRKLHSLFIGYALAYLENRDYSQLLYVHLTPTKTFKQTVTIIDKLGRAWGIQLDDVVFLVQRKGETLRSILKDQLDHQQIEEAKQTLSKVLDMYVAEYHRGLYDRDPGVMQNTGFIDGQAFHLDVGKLTKEDRMRQPDNYKKDLRIIVWKIDQWLQQAYPQEYAVLSHYLADEYTRLTQDRFDPNQIDIQTLKKRRVKCELES